MRSRTVFVAWIAVWLAACSDDPGSRIEVTPGTSIYVTEGVPDRHTLIRFEDKKAADFHVSESTRLVVNKVDTADGALLELTANCSAVTDHGGAVSEELVVSVPTSDVAPVVIIVEIEPSADGVCAVAVVGWAGSCDEKPDPVPDHIMLDTASTDQRVCVEVYVPESLATLDTHFANIGLLQPLEISGPDMIELVQGSNKGQLDVTNVNETFRGERDLQVTWPGGSHALRLVAGSPGDGVLRQRGGPMPVNEYDKVDVLVGSSYYAKTGTVACVRATPRDSSATLVLRTETLLVAQGDLACDGIVNTMEIVTGLDSQPQELVDIELLRCEGCTGNAEQLTACCRLAEVEQLDTSVITVRSRSVTESIPVASQGARACVDLENDGVPEVIVSDSSGARIRAATTTLAGSPDLRFDVTESAIEKPTTMFSLSWWDGGVARPTLIGDFATAPELRQLNGARWDDKAWIQRPLTARPPREWLPLEPARGMGASYLVVQQSDYVISFECLSTACTDGPPIDVRDLSGGGTVDLNQKLYGIGVADFDGDGDLDVLAVVDAFGGNTSAGSTRPLTVYAYDLYWNQHALVGYKPAEILKVTPTEIPWQTLQFVSIAQPSKADIVYVLAKGNAIQHAVIEIAPCAGPGCPMTSTLDTIGRPFEIAEVDGSLFTSTDLGIWELSALHWIQRDPERARTQQTTFPVPDPTSIYGRSLRRCFVGGATPASSMLFDADGAVRWTLANVEVETLPAAED